MFYPLEKNSEKPYGAGGEGGGEVGIQIAQPLKNKTVRAEMDLTNKTYIDNNTRFSHPYGHQGHQTAIFGKYLFGRRFEI